MRHIRKDESEEILQVGKEVEDEITGKANEGELKGRETKEMKGELGTLWLRIRPENKEREKKVPNKNVKKSGDYARMMMREEGER